jgi:hypothetical protein
MSAISSVAGVNQMPVHPPVKAPEGSPMEEAHESPAEKAREQQQAPVQAAAPSAPSAPGVGGAINVMA